MTADTIAICRHCGKEIRWTGTGWGHVVNPGPRHHYATPKGKA